MWLLFITFLVILVQGVGLLSKPLVQGVHYGWNILMWVAIFSLALLGAFMFNNYQKILHDDEDNDEEVNLKNDEASSIATPVMNQPIIRSFQETSIAPKESSYKMLTYSEFKNLVKENWYVEEYYQAFRNSLAIKQKEYSKLLKTLQKDKAKISSNNISIIDNPTDSKAIEAYNTGIKECNVVLDLISNREKKVQVKHIRNNLLKTCQLLDGVVGCDPAKDLIALKINAFKCDPHTFLNSFQNIIITGNPGIGKTHLATIIAKAYCNSGILLKKNPTIISPHDLGTAYVQESGRLTKKYLYASLESVLFIDEAYQLAPNKLYGADHNEDVITEIVNSTDKLRGKQVVIPAGYKEEMENKFLKANAGLPRRFPHSIHLNNYTSSELTHICLHEIRKSLPKLNLNAEEENTLYTLIKDADEKGAFPNQGGDIANFVGVISTTLHGIATDISLREKLIVAMEKYLSSKHM